MTILDKLLDAGVRTPDAAAVYTLAQIAVATLEHNVGHLRDHGATDEEIDAYREKGRADLNAWINENLRSVTDAFDARMTAKEEAKRCLG